MAKTVLSRQEIKRLQGAHKLWPEDERLIKQDIADHRLAAIESRRKKRLKSRHAGMSGGRPRRQVANAKRSVAWQTPEISETATCLTPNQLKRPEFVDAYLAGMVTV